MQPSIDRLKKARVKLARTIAHHDNPYAFLPVFRRLDQEIAALQEDDAYLSNIMDLAALQPSA